jgi:hypothetical protein
MKQGKNTTGWNSAIPGGRPLRDRAHGLAGQEIWFELQRLGFVHSWKPILKREGVPPSGEPKTVWEQKLKNWLIFGYWEK